MPQFDITKTFTLHNVLFIYNSILRHFQNALTQGYAPLNSFTCVQVRLSPLYFFIFIRFHFLCFILRQQETPKDFCFSQFLKIFYVSQTYRPILCIYFNKNNIYFQFCSIRCIQDCIIISTMAGLQYVVVSKPTERFGVTI